MPYCWKKCSNKKKLPAAGSVDFRVPTYWKSTQKMVYFVTSENCQLLNYCQLLNNYGPVTKARRRRKFFEGLGAKPPLAQNPGYVPGHVYLILCSNPTFMFLCCFNFHFQWTLLWIILKHLLIRLFNFVMKFLTCTLVVVFITKLSYYYYSHTPLFRGFWDEKIGSKNPRNRGDREIRGQLLFTVMT